MLFQPMNIFVAQKDRRKAKNDNKICDEKGVAVQDLAHLLPLLFAYTSSNFLFFFDVVFEE